MVFQEKKAPKGGSVYFQKYGLMTTHLRRSYVGEGKVLWGKNRKEKGAGERAFPGGSKVSTPLRGEARGKTILSEKLMGKKRAISGAHS